MKNKIVMNLKEGTFAFTGDHGALQSLGTRIREYFVRTLKITSTVEVLRLGPENKLTLTIRLNISHETSVLLAEKGIETISVPGGYFRVVRFPIETLDERMDAVLSRALKEERGPLCINPMGTLFFRIGIDSKDLEDYLASIRIEITPKSSRGRGGAGKAGFIALFSNVTTENLDRLQSAFEILWRTLTPYERRLLIKRLNRIS